MSCKQNPKCALGYSCQFRQLDGKMYNQVYGIRNDNDYLEGVDIMLVGANVNWEDERNQLVFQGNLGRKIKYLLEKSNIDTSRVFMTNTVRCNPPKKKKPNSSEREACLPYLRREIKNLRPKVIVPMGNEACMALGIRGLGGINKIRGEKFEVDIDGEKFIAVPIVNPASLLARPSPRTEFRTITDLQDIAVLAGHSFRVKNNPASVQYEVVDTIERLEQVFDEIEANGAMAYDTESPSYEWWKNPCIMVQISIGKNKNYIFPIYKHDPDSTGEFKLKQGMSDEVYTYFLTRLSKLFSIRKYKIIGHNLKYDLHVIANELGWEDLQSVEAELIDTSILAWIIDSHSPIDLEFLGAIDLGYPNYTHDIEQIVGTGKNKTKSYDHIPDETFHPYAATDAEITYLLYLKYWQKLLSQPVYLNYYYNESQPLLRVLWEAERKGFPYNKELFDKMHQQEVNKAANKEAELQALAATVLPQDALPVNFNSPQQVVKFMIGLGYQEEIADESKSSGYTTGKDIIAELAESDQRLTALSDYRKARKFVTSYLEDFPAMSDSQHLIHGSYKIPGTTSGRLSARLLHQIARTDKDAIKRGEIVFRQLFTSLPGYTLVYADYSQLELRMLAVASGDKGLIELFEKKQDIHNRMTGVILGIPEDRPGEVMAHSHKKPARCDEFCQVVLAEVEPNRSEIGKRVNFGLAYGSEGHKLVSTAIWKDINGNEHPVTWMMLEEGMARWQQEFPLAATFKTLCVEQAKKNNGYAVTEYGRARYFGDILKNPASTQYKKAERDLVNHRIQSPSASLLNRTLIMMQEIKEDLVAKNQLDYNDFYLACTVHDSCTYMVKDEYVPWFKDVLMSVMHRPVPEFNNHVFTADCGVGKTWYDAENNSKSK